MLTAADLAAYKPEWKEPLHTDVSRPRRLQQSGDLARRLRSADGTRTSSNAVDLKAAGPGSPAALHAMIEAIKISKADIYRYVADPKFVKVPTAGLLSRDFAATRRALFDPSKAIPYPPAGAPDGGPTSMPRGDGPVFDDRYDGEQHTTVVLDRRSSSATRSAARRRSAASSATTWWSATPGCC